MLLRNPAHKYSIRVNTRPEFLCSLVIFVHQTSYLENPKLAHKEIKK